MSNTKMLGEFVISYIVKWIDLKTLLSLLVKTIEKQNWTNRALRDHDLFKKSATCEKKVFSFILAENSRLAKFGKKCTHSF